jgi:hypothetical protein
MDLKIPQAGSQGSESQGSENKDLENQKLAAQLFDLKASVEILTQEVLSLKELQHTILSTLERFADGQGWQPLTPPEIAPSGSPLSPEPPNKALALPEPLDGDAGDWPAIAGTYNQDPHYWQPYAVAVSETPASLERRRKNSYAQQVTLAPSSNPSYWVVTHDARHYWLIPKADFRVSGPSFDTFQALFKSEGAPNNRFYLVKPAAVKMITATHDWELQGQGEVKFINA